MKVYEYEKNSRNQLTERRFLRKIYKICRPLRTRRTPPRKKRNFAGEKGMSPADRQPESVDTLSMESARTRFAYALCKGRGDFYA